MSEDNKPPIKKVSSLSEQVLEYYNKFAQNRDLEKYLRFRQNYNKSSSEGSISTPSCASRIPSSRQSKSLDQLNFTKGISSIEDEPLLAQQQQQQQQQQQHHQEKEEQKVQVDQEEVHIIRKEFHPGDEKMFQPEIKMKTKRIFTKPDNPYMFSCESNIAINLPPFIAETKSMPELIPRPETATEYSQTDYDVKTPPQPIDYEEDSINVSQNKSPESNSKAASKRLEWDSLGDVGYNKNSTPNKKHSRSLSTLERSVLTDFFADRGIELKFNFEQKKLQEYKQLRIKEEQEQQQQQEQKKSNQGAIPKKSKEKWRETFESLKEKYIHNQSNSNKSNPTQQQAVWNINSAMHLSNLLSTNQHSTPKMENLEKYCQTSFIKTQAKEVQVDFSNGGSIKSSVDVGSTTSPSSFEYFPNRMNSQEASDKENISPRRLSLEHERKLRQSAKKLLTTKRNASRQSSNESTTDLELGIKLLCSLIESKSLNDKQKKSLARKIVLKITKDNLILSSKNSTNTSSVPSRGILIESAKQPAVVGNVSGVVTLSSTSTTNSSSRTVDSVRNKSTSQDGSRNISDNCNNLKNSNENHVKDEGVVLKEKENKRITLNKNSKLSCASNSGQSSTGSESGAVRKSVKDIERFNQTEQGKNVIEQDATMKEWLDPLTKSELEYNRKKSETVKQKSENMVADPLAGGDSLEVENNRPSKLLDFVKKETKSHLKWIENEIERLENLKNLLLTNDELEKGKDFSKPNTIFAYPVQCVQKSVKERKSEFKERQQSSASANSSRPEENEIYDLTNIKPEIEIVNPKKNYRATMKKISATKEILCENISNGKGNKLPIKTTTFFIEEEKRFSKSDYVCPSKSKERNESTEEEEEERSKLETPISCTRDDSSIRSYAKQRKEEFLANYRKVPKRIYDKPAESDHYSEPKETEMKQCPTSNAYTSVSSSDIFISSDSVSIPISASSSTTTTTHQYDNRVAIGVQTTDSILRTRPIYSTRLECGCVNQCCCKNLKPTVREYRPKQNKQVQAKPPPLAYTITFENCKKSKEDSHNSTESLTLQEHLEKRLPEFQKKCSDRQKVLRKMHKLRNEREMKIREIIENTSSSSISRKLKDLPPPPTKYTRIFPTREMKAITKRKYLKLPEVMEKVEREKIERRKKSNKVLADVFNKRLQRRVHKGKLTLEHSNTVI